MDSGYLRNALLTASEASQQFMSNIHLSDANEIVTARNIFAVSIILSQRFNPEIVEDMMFIWNVLFSFEWDYNTSERFRRNVKLILNGNNSRPFRVSDSKTWDKVKSVFESWLENLENNLDQPFKYDNYSSR